jgi:hypothetical protein
MALNQFPRRSFVGSSTIQTFTGNGTQTAFTLNSAQTQNEVFLFVDDVVQVPGVDFGVNGTTLTFTSAPANNAEIIVRGFGVPLPVNVISDGTVTSAKLATGAIESKLGYTPVSPTQLSTEVANLVDAAPSTLNTLNELAAALGDDPNYATTITAALGTKANASSLGTLATKSTIGTDDITNSAVTDAKISTVSSSKLSGRVPRTNAPSESIIQVVQNTETGIVSFNNSNGTFIIVNITPTSTTSRILISGYFIWSSDNPNGYFALERSIGGGAWTGVANIASYDEVAANGNAWNAPVNYVDSPSTTSTITYRIYWYHNIQNGGTMYMNRSFSNDALGFYSGGRTGKTVLIAQEIAG